MEANSTATTIESDGWPAPINASPDVIRVTLYSGEKISSFRFKMARWDRWELWGIHEPKKGWNIRTGSTRVKRELSAVRSGSKYAGQQMRLSFPWFLFNRFEFFSTLDAEKVALEFLEGASPPSSVQWVELQYD